MRDESKTGLQIGDLEYCVGPSGASDAVTGSACEIFVTIFRVGIHFVDL